MEDKHLNGEFISETNSPLIITCKNQEKMLKDKSIGQINNKNVNAAKKGNEIGIKVKEKVRKDYKVYKVTSSK